MTRLFWGSRQRSRRYCLAGSVGFIVLIIVGVVFLQKLKVRCRFWWHAVPSLRAALTFQSRWQLFTLQYTNPATEAGESAGAQV